MTDGAASAKARVVITLARGTIPGLARLLRAVGIEATHRPLIHFAPPRTWLPLDQAIAALGTGGTLIVTSPRAAKAVRCRISTLGGHWGGPDVIWAAGATSGAPFRSTPAEIRIPRSREPGLSLGATIAGAIGRDPSPAPIVFARGEPCHPGLEQGLRDRGFRFLSPIVYRAIVAAADSARHAAASGDVLIVGSAQVAILLAPVAPGTEVVTIGPTTSRAARAMGLRVLAEARAPTGGEVADAVRRALAA